jgi:prephenate dehydratase
MPALRLAFLGPRGTFTEQAALLYAPHAELIAAPSIADVTQFVIAGQADEAILPIENSLIGPVNETLDLLIHALELKIRAEIVLPIVHCLIGPEGTALADVAAVYSKPEALGQCVHFLRDELPAAEQRPALSTAGAVEQALAEPRTLAIAPERAAELLGGAVLRRGIEDDHRNKTRFVVLGNDDVPPSGDDKTSLAFHTRDMPGALVRALLPFSDAGIDLSKIESRPAKEELGVYVFLVDCAGHRLEPEVAGVLEQLRGETTMLKIFGSYPRFVGD